MPKGGPLQQNQRIKRNTRPIPTQKKLKIPKEVKKETSKEKLNSGQWSNKQAFLFLKAYCQNVNDWNQISIQIGSRTVNQVRSYAQKAFPRMKEARQMKLNLEHINDPRYSHNRPVPTEMIQLDGSSRRSHTKRLRRQTRLAELEQKALELFQTAKNKRVQVPLEAADPQPVAEVRIERTNQIEPFWLAWKTFRGQEPQRDQRQMRTRQSERNQGQQIQLGLVKYQQPRQEAVTILTKKNN